MRKIRLLVLLGVIVVIQSCGGSGSTGVVTPPSPPPAPPPPPSPGTCPANTICMLSATFDPTQLSVAKGTVVSFQNNSGVTHNPVFDAPKTTGVTDIGMISSGTVTRTFNESGTWNFHCTIHAGMTGQITVP